MFLPPVENNREAPQCCQTIPFRLVKPAILMQEDDGILSKELIALDDKKFTSASSKRKLALVQYIQKLRLILWLLERRNYQTFRNNYLGRPARSCFGYQGSLNSSWNLANTYTDLLRGLRVKNISLSATLPWIREKAWLQHMFNSVRDHDPDAKRTMMIIFNEWIRVRFPETDDREKPQDYLTLPMWSISANPIFTPDSQEGGISEPPNEDDNFGQFDSQEEYKYPFEVFDTQTGQYYLIVSFDLVWHYLPANENFCTRVTKILRGRSHPL
jgi:hypothetical protein